MKKYLFLLLSVLSIFFISDRVDALSFTATNGKEYTVDSEEKLLDYCYYKYFKDKNNNTLILARTDNSTYPYKCFSDTSIKNYIYTRGNSFVLYNFSPKNTYMYFQFKANFDYLTSGRVIQDGIEILYSNVDVYTDNTFTNVYQNANFSIDDIEERYGEIPKYKITYYVNNEVYRVFEVEKGSSHTLIDYEYNSDLYNSYGWTYDSNIDLNNITSDINIYRTIEQKYITPVYVKNFNDFSITRTDFYALLVLLATLIIFLFLRWCFPMKGGRNL